MQRHSKKEMYAHIEKWQKSSQTQKAYSEHQGFSRHVFKYWHQKYKKEKLAEIKASSVSGSRRKKRSDFVALKRPKNRVENQELLPAAIAKSPMSTSIRLHIHYPNGVSVDIEQAACEQSAIELGILLGLRI